MSSTARVGWSIFLAALALYLLRRGGIEAFSHVDSTVYAVILLAGLFGAGVGVVDLVVTVSKWIWSSFNEHAANRKKRAPR